MCRKWSSHRHTEFTCCACSDPTVDNDRDNLLLTEFSFGWMTQHKWLVDDVSDKVRKARKYYLHLPPSFHFPSHVTSPTSTDRLNAVFRVKVAITRYPGVLRFPDRQWNTVCVLAQVVKPWFNLARPLQRLLSVSAEKSHPLPLPQRSVVLHTSPRVL